MNKPKAIAVVLACAVGGILTGSAIAVTPSQQQHGSPGTTPSVPTTPAVQATTTVITAATTPTTTPTPPTTQGVTPTTTETTGSQPLAGGEQGEQGVAGQGQESPAGDVAGQRVSPSNEAPTLLESARGALPFTGFQAAIALLGGIGAAAAGFGLRRGARKRNS